MLSSRFFSKIPSLIKLTGPGIEVELIINTDSRSFRRNETFVALHGDNFDGFNYVEQVLKEGARVIVYSEKVGREEIVLGFAKLYPDV